MLGEEKAKVDPGRVEAMSRNRGKNMRVLEVSVAVYCWSRKTR